MVCTTERQSQRTDQHVRKVGGGGKVGARPIERGAHTGDRGGCDPRACIAIQSADDCGSLIDAGVYPESPQHMRARNRQCCPLCRHLAAWECGDIFEIAREVAVRAHKSSDPEAHCIQHRVVFGQ